MTRTTERGFSLIELAITVALLGVLLSFSIPALRSLSESYQLRGAAENVAGQLRLAREKAIAVGSEQPIHVPNTTTYHIHYTTGIATSWTLPRGVTFTPATLNAWFRMQPDGRCTSSGLIVLSDRRGHLDTVSVQMSGLVLTR